MMMHILCSLGSRGKADRHAEQHEDPGQEPDGHCQEEEEGPGRAGGQQVGHTYLVVVLDFPSMGRRFSDPNPNF